MTAPDQPAERDLFRPAVLDQASMAETPGRILVAPTRRLGRTALRVLVEWFAGVVDLIRSLVGGRPVPVVTQMELTDCGAACLAMVAAFHGLPVDLSTARALTGTGRDGVDAKRILEGARRCGLQGRGVRVELSDLAHVPRGSVLHWNLQHFVVLDHVAGDRVHVVDPAYGPRRLSKDEVGRSFTGIALLFQPSGVARQGGAVRVRSWRHLRLLVVERGVWARVLAVTLALQLGSLVVPWLTKTVVDQVIPTADRAALRAVALGSAAIAVVFLALYLLRTMAVAVLRARLDSSVSMKVSSHLASLSPLFFASRTTGDLMMRLRSMTAVRQVFTTTVFSTVVDGGLVVVNAIVLLTLDRPFALVVGCLACLMGCTIAASWARYRTLTASALEAQSRAQSELLQFVSGIETIKALGLEHRAVEKWSHALVDEIQSDLTRTRHAGVSEALIAAMRFAAPLLLLVLGAVRVIGGDLTLGNMLALSALGVAVLVPFASLTAAAFQLSTLRGHLDRIEDLLGEDCEQAVGLPPMPPITGSIRLEDVAFAYGSSGPRVLSGVTLDIPQGAAVAIVGRTGSGKSTLAKVMSGLYEPTSGRVLIDGLDIWQHEIGSVRSQLGVVLQSPFVFNGRIRDNIAMGDPAATTDLVVAAARSAQLHGDVREFPLRYRTVLNDAGSNLSGGQRQRLAIARALYRSPRVLVLDESTNALDAATELALLQEIRRLGVTLVLVTHRVETAHAADLVVVVDDGTVVETGAPGDLVRHEGAYAATYATSAARWTRGEGGDDTCTVAEAAAALGVSERRLRRRLRAQQSAALCRGTG